ncbi:hypothetical protein [Varibaculum timonense]|nr:hypothetical protein [Varibaculum timonense]
MDNSYSWIHSHYGKWVFSSRVKRGAISAGKAQGWTAVARNSSKPRENVA